VPERVAPQYVIEPCPPHHLEEELAPRHHHHNLASRLHDWANGVQETTVQLVGGRWWADQSLAVVARKQQHIALSTVHHHLGQVVVFGKSDPPGWVCHDRIKSRFGEAPALTGCELSQTPEAGKANVHGTKQTLQPHAPASPVHFLRPNEFECRKFTLHKRLGCFSVRTCPLYYRLTPAARTVRTRG